MTKQLTRLEQKALGADLAVLSRRVCKRAQVLFFGRPTFVDNSKYLFLHAVARAQAYEVIWCTFNDDVATMLAANGLPVVHLGRDADRSIDLLLHAAVAVFTINPDDSLGGSTVLQACLDGAQQVQLWHGVSVKRLVLQLIPHFGVRANTLRQPWLASSRADYVLSPARVFDRYWREVFGCRQLVRANFPRNAVIGRQATPHELLGAELEPHVLEALQSTRPAVLVVPTWQRGASTELGRPEFMVEAIRYARQHQVNLFFKVHPTYFGRTAAAQGRTESVHVLDPGLDIYPWLFRFNALVTDYSSIMFDFLLTGQPVLTLDLAPGEHQNYEPDYTLVPSGDFRILFDTASFAARMHEALHADHGREARLAYAAQIFETDPQTAGADLMQLIDALVARSQVVDHTVWQAPGDLA